MIRRVFSVMCAACALLVVPASVQAEVSYGDVYANAVADAMARHNGMLNSGDLTEDFYSAIGYTLSDITGDGLDELIVQQVTDKHWAEYWIYGTDGYGCYHMGDFGCDSAGSRGDLYGFIEGVLYEEAYKGNLSLGFAEWTGDGFSVTKLYEGSYDRDGNPPTIPDLSSRYDSSRLLNEITGFEELHDGTYVQKKSSSDDRFDLDNYGYRSVTTTDSKGALVFQSEPDGSFMFDYEFWDGDKIYVNLDWRQDGYAIAYQDGVYGYVDAGYIDWDSSGSSGTTQGIDLEWYRTYNYFEGEDGSVLEICFYDYGDFEVIVNGEIWFYFNKYDYRVGDNGALEYIKGKNIFSFYPDGYVGIYSRGNEDYYY